MEHIHNPDEEPIPFDPQDDLGLDPTVPPDKEIVELSGGDLTLAAHELSKWDLKFALEEGRVTREGYDELRDDLDWRISNRRRNLGMPERPEDTEEDL